MGVLKKNFFKTLLRVFKTSIFVIKTLTFIFKIHFQDACRCCQDVKFFVIKALIVFFKTPFQDVNFLFIKTHAFRFQDAFSRHMQVFSRDFFLTPKTSIKFSRQDTFLRHIFFQDTYLLCLENSQKRLESNLGFLSVSSKFFDYVLKGVLI